LILLLSTYPAVLAGNTGNITILAVGDIMMGTTFPKKLLPPDDGAHIFRGVGQHLKGADILFGNLEGPLTDAGEPQKCKTESDTCYEFRTPVRYVKYLREAGFNVLNIANNHATDFGREGLESTISALRDERIQATGGSMVSYFGVNGKKIAVAGFSYVDRNPYSGPVSDMAEAASVVRELKRCNDIVIASFHGGAEGKDAAHVKDEEEYYLGEDRGNVMLFAHTVIDAGADLVIGHGPHVLRAMEIYKGKLIAYSLGNFLTYERFNVSGPNGISMILQVTLDANGDFIDGSIQPLQLGESGIPVIDPEKKAIGLIKGLITDDIQSSHLKIGDDGRILQLDPS